MNPAKPILQQSLRIQTAVGAARSAPSSARQTPKRVKGTCFTEESEHSHDLQVIHDTLAVVHFRRCRLQELGSEIRTLPD